MSKKRILIIEDSFTSFLLITETLKFEGYETLLAETVKEAITTINKEPPDLIILDLNMPEVTGYDFLKMRKELKIETIPIIVISAMDSPLSIQQAKAMGASEFISKPVKLDMVIEKVKSLIR